MSAHPYDRVTELDTLRKNNAAWRLLNSQNAPLVLSFLGSFFIEDNRGAVGENVLLDALDEYLYAIHLVDSEMYSQDAKHYVDDWADPERGWLRKFYPTGSDEVHYDATSAVEKAHRWVQTLQTRAMVGTESRLQTMVELLRQITYGAEMDPQIRRDNLLKQRSKIDEELALLDQGVLSRSEGSSLRDRYQLFLSTSRDLMADFRAVEENFRSLDRSAREKIAQWDGGKGELLADLVESRTDISASDEGRSFQAFYDFLLSNTRQEELSALLSSITTIEEIDADPGVRTIHHDWAEGAERTQATVRSLSEQLRTFLEDRVWLENRRVLELIRSIEKTAVATRDTPHKDGEGLTIPVPGLPIALPLARPLHTQREQVLINSFIEPEAPEQIDLTSLLTQRFVDQARLVEHIKACVPPRSKVALPEIVALYPLQEGLAELLGYLDLHEDDITIEIDDDLEMTIYYEQDSVSKRVITPGINVVRK